MKTFVTALILTALIAGVTTANGQEQGSPEGPNYALSLRMAALAAYESTYGEILAAPSMARRLGYLSSSVSSSASHRSPKSPSAAFRATSVRSERRRAAE